MVKACLHGGAPYDHSYVCMVENHADLNVYAGAPCSPQNMKLVPSG